MLRNERARALLEVLDAVEGWGLALKRAAITVDSFASEAEIMEDLIGKVPNDALGTLLADPDACAAHDLLQVSAVYSESALSWLVESEFEVEALRAEVFPEGVARLRMRLHDVPDDDTAEMILDAIPAFSDRVVTRVLSADRELRMSGDASAGCLRQYRRDVRVLKGHLQRLGLTSR